MTTNPVERLAADRQLARERQDPCANLCTLANVDDDGLPQVRTLVLRELEAKLAVFVNASSPKWQPLLKGPIAIVVWLPTVNVQYRLSCQTKPVPDGIVAESWLDRPPPPKRMDWLYTRFQAQSTEIESREKLLAEIEGLDVPDPLVAPSTAKGLYLAPTLIDRLDLGQENGIHDRRRYLLGNPGWYEKVLIP